MVVFRLAASPFLMILALKATDTSREGVAKLIVAVLALIATGVHDIVLVPQNAGSLTFLGAMFIVVPSPLFAWLWPWLEWRGLNRASPRKWPSA